MSDQQTQSKGFDMAKKKVVEIKNWLTGDVIATGEEGETLRDLVVRKVAEHADLSDAVLRGAVLRGAVLSDAVLSDAVLSDADLRGAV
ncbi:MAG TPA: pentapeptide repeat-containing protein, partial [Pyrinomonadaceae bacterium]